MKAEFMGLPCLDLALFSVFPTVTLGNRVEITGYEFWFRKVTGIKECVPQSSWKQLGSSPSSPSPPPTLFSAANSLPRPLYYTLFAPLMRHFCISTTNCLYSQPLSSRFRRPRTLRSLTAVQFSKSWGEPGVGHDPAFTPGARRATSRSAAQHNAQSREPALPSRNMFSLCRISFWHLLCLLFTSFLAVQHPYKWFQVGWSDRFIQI